MKVTVSMTEEEIKQALIQKANEQIKLHNVEFTLCDLETSTMTSETMTAEIVGWDKGSES